MDSLRVRRDMNGFRVRDSMTMLRIIHDEAWWLGARNDRNLLGVREGMARSEKRVDLPEGSGRGFWVP